MTEATTIAAFDARQLEQSLAMLGREAVLDVVRRFEGLAGEFIALSAGGDTEALLTSAHGIAGCARYIGLPRLGELCREVEMAGRGGDDAAMLAAAALARRMLETVLAEVLAHPGLAPGA